MRAPLPACLLVTLVLVACGDPGEAPVTPTDRICAATAPVQLAPGEYSIIDPRSDSGCVALAGLADQTVEYVGIVSSVSGLVVSSGVRGEVLLRSGSEPSVAVARGSRVQSGAPAAGAEAFHQRLREREARIAPAVGRTRSVARPPALVASMIGDEREFLACADLGCTTYTRVGARAAYVGRAIEIFVDTLAPADGFTAPEIQAVGDLFDTQLFEIDTTAFGAPSDLDGNQKVIALLTPAVNQLAGGCNSSGFKILGYFNGVDLAPGEPGSNAAEVFFAMVPDPSSATCTISREFALDQLPVTFVHEFQHMISFNQHVLLRGGRAEETWLNEGLSHFAEELAGQLVPDEPGSPANTRLNQFAFKDVDNAYGYLLSPQEHFLITPGLSAGSSAERGANWLFVRWLVDHFGGATDVAAPVTRPLVGTSLVGQANVEQLTGLPFATLVAEWQLAAALDDGAGNAPGRLGFPSWAFRDVFARLHQQDPGRFPRAYPVEPEPLGREMALNLPLRGGSGWYFRYVAATGARPYRLRLTGPDDGDLPTLAEPRLVIYRVR